MVKEQTSEGAIINELYFPLQLSFNLAVKDVYLSQPINDIQTRFHNLDNEESHIHFSSQKSFCLAIKMASPVW